MTEGAQTGGGVVRLRFGAGHPDAQTAPPSFRRLGRQQQTRAALFQNRPAQLQAERPGRAQAGDAHRGLAPEALPAVRGQRLDDQVEVVGDQPGVRADGGAARTFQGLQRAALGGDSQRCRPMVDLGDPARRGRRPPSSGWPGTPGPAPAGARPGRAVGGAGRQGQGGAGRSRPTGWRLPRRAPAWPGGCRRCRASPGHRGRAARTATGSGGAAKAVPSTAPWGRSSKLAYLTERKASRGSSRSGWAASTRPLGDQRGHVLQRVDRHIDAAIEQGLLDLLGEEALAPLFQQPPVLDAVAGGGDLDQRRDLTRLSLVEAEGHGDEALHHPRLGEGQFRGSGADADEWLLCHGVQTTSIT